jgi:hypothetical protein
MCVILDGLNGSKIVYMAVPKTGTTSTCIFLKGIQSSTRVRPKHCRARQIKKKMNNKHEIFGVIRNPYDWYVSWYTYRQRNGAGASSKNMSFKEYLIKYPHQEMLNYFTDNKGNMIVDTVLKYEDNIETEIKKFLLKKLKHTELSTKFGYINKSMKRTKKSYRDYYDKDTIQMVKNLQKKTLKKFGYTF